MLVPGSSGVIAHRLARILTAGYRQFVEMLFDDPEPPFVGILFVGFRLITDTDVEAAIVRLAVIEQPSRLGKKGTVAQSSIIWDLTKRYLAFLADAV